MTDLSRWPHADELLDAALALPAAERPAFVREAAGADQELAAALLAVLAEADTQDGFLTPGGAMAGALAGDLAHEESGDRAPRMQPGDRFGGYEIREAIGRGGMGEVYRARDTRLGRDVALKVLPRRFATDPGRHGRFEREARLLASLNHPHIAAIYDIEEQQGIVALVLELVDGPTLADRVRDGRLPIERTLAIAAQMAGALAAAHQRGIVHRDLKPANVKLTTDGDVKILDFGIAKALAPPGSPDAVDPSLLTTPLTTAGQPTAILGTAPYVSPEHARGLPTDHRTDVWAFGCVLYELLTGVRAFDGGTATDVIARILEREPDFSKLPARTPPSLRRLLTRTFRKDPAKRLGFIGDALLDIDDAREELAGKAVGARPPSEAWRAAAVVGAVALVAGIAAGAVAMWRQMQAPPPAPVHLAVAVPDQDDLIAGELPGVALSPDERTIVYRARRDGQIQLVRKSLADGTTEPIPGSTNGAAPFFSPDGQWIGFSGESQLMKVPVSGGQPVMLADAPGGARGTWVDAGTIVFSAGAGRGIFRVPATGGQPVAVAAPDQAAGHLSYESPFVLPRGRHALVTILLADSRQVGLLDLEAGSVRALTEGQQPVYVPGGYVLLTRGDAIWAAPFDLTTLSLTSEPVSMVEGIELGNLNGTAHFAVGDDGTLVYMPRRPTLGLRTPVWVDRTGAEEVVPVEPRAYTRASVSPDGGRIALAVASPENRDIWIYELARGAFMRLTVDPATDTAPIWSPDGSRIAFRSEREGGGLFLVDADAAGRVERLTRADGPSRPAHTPYAFTPDGLTLLFTELRSYSDQGIGAVAVEPDAPVQMIIDGPYAETRPSVSPDGRWLAYQSDESGRYEVYVRPYPDVDAGRTQISISGGTSPRWSHDGQEIIFHDGNAMLAVRVTPGQPFGVGRPTVLFEATRYNERLGPLYDIAPDDTRFLFLREGGPEGPAGRRSDLRLIQHWTERLKERFR